MGNVLGALIDLPPKGVVPPLYAIAGVDSEARPPPKPGKDGLPPPHRVNLTYLDRGELCRSPGILHNAEAVQWILDVGAKNTKPSSTSAEEEAKRELREIWDEFVHRKLPEIQKKHLPLGVLFYWLYFILVWFPLTILSFWWCCKIDDISMEEADRYDRAMKNWQNEFNKKLGKYCIFCKTQSHQWLHYTTNNNGTTHEHYKVARWVSFALTPAACQKLQDEPHLKGVLKEQNWKYFVPATIAEQRVFHTPQEMDTLPYWWYFDKEVQFAEGSEGVTWQDSVMAKGVV